MKALEWIRQHVARRRETILRTADTHTETRLVLLGIASGLIAGLVMVAFRMLIETPQVLMFGIGHPEAYEQLSPLGRFLLPVAGGLLLGVIFQRLAGPDRQVGVVHVMERLAYNEGHLPIKNAGVQFVGAALSILAGHSVGREGPSIHIGAACGSWTGQRLHLPNHQIRILAGCGTAGAIAAAFNTPLAGVVFAMEVVLLEYSIASFIPIILAAVGATAVAQWAFGPQPVFAVPAFGLGSLRELAYITAMGILLGIIAAAFVRLLVMVSARSRDWPVWRRMAAAGLFVGALALPLPQIMGIGYDTVNQSLAGGLGLGLMVLVLGGKLLASAVGLGLGLPGGVIGPALVIGAMAGGAVGVVLESFVPGSTPSGFYAVLGMGAMMGATLNAPLAALTALLELTANPQVILPGMLAIVMATLTSQQFLHTPSVFLLLMRSRGLTYHSDPITQFLRRLGVTGFMERRVVQLPRRRLTRQRLDGLLEDPSGWLLIRDAQAGTRIVFTADLVRYREEAAGEEPELDLYELPVHRLDVAPVSAQSTLLGALHRMEKEQVEALYVVPPHGGRVLGVITRQDIERSYRFPSA